VKDDEMFSDDYRRDIENTIRFR